MYKIENTRVADPFQDMQIGQMRCNILRETKEDIFKTNHCIRTTKVDDRFTSMF